MGEVNFYMVKVILLKKKIEICAGTENKKYQALEKECNLQSTDTRFMRGFE